MSIKDEIYKEQQVDRAAAGRTRFLNKRVQDLTAEAKELQAQIDFYQSARTEPVNPPVWTVKPKKAGRHHGLAVAQTTDWHLDEVVRPEEVFGLNAYNEKIATQRIKRWMEKVVTLPRDYVNGVELDGLVIPSTGDLFTGDIHKELEVTNERPLLASLLHWQEPMIGVLETLEKEYPAVYVAAVVGNHGRRSPKPIFKGRVYDNVEWLFWSTVRDRLRDRGSKVKVDVSVSMDLNLPLYGRNHLLTHGDQFKGGSGIAGAYSPLALGSHRKDKRQRIAQMPMETMVIGHLHQLINIPGVKMGGCLKGYDEFAFGINAAPDPNGAAQAFWITSPERAEVMWMPIYVAGSGGGGLVSEAVCGVCGVPVGMGAKGLVHLDAIPDRFEYHPPVAVAGIIPEEPGITPAERQAAAMERIADAVELVARALYGE